MHLEWYLFGKLNAWQQFSQLVANPVTQANTILIQRLVGMLGREPYGCDLALHSACGLNGTCYRVPQYNKVEDVENELHTPPQKLADVLKGEFPEATNISLSFAEKWEFVNTIEHPHGRIYLVGFPIERASNGREHFYGLGPEINVNLVFYRLYKFFQPWPMPQIDMEWNMHSRQGRVTDVRSGRVQMQPVGQAQAWFGVTHAVLWECYFDESRRFADWQGALANGWQWVEQDLNTARLFTAPHDPAFPQGYREFLTGMGYARDSEYPVWWSKNRIESLEDEHRQRIAIGDGD